MLQNVLDNNQLLKLTGIDFYAQNFDSTTPERNNGNAERVFCLVSLTAIV